MSAAMLDPALNLSGRGKIAAERQKFKRTPMDHGTAMDEIVTIRPAAETMTKQRLPNFVGVSGATCGAKGISMNLIVIPPGGAAAPHLHKGYETAIYLVQGQVETRYGKGLKKSVVNQAGDFIFIPADVPHQPVNLSQSEAAIAVVARNDPNEQESVVPYEAGEEGK